MSEILKYADSLKWTPDPRYPQYKCSGVFGLDEFCLAAYFNDLAAAMNTDGRQVAESIRFDEFRPVFNSSIHLFGRKFNTNTRLYPEEHWPNSSILHFPGPSKDRLFEYCNKLSAD